MRRLFSISLLSLLFTSAYAQSSTTDTLIKFYSDRVQKYLDKEKMLDGYYTIDQSGIKMYASPHKKEVDSAEFVLKWKDRLGFQSDLKWSDITTQLNTYKKNAGGPYVIVGGPKVMFAEIPSDKPLLGKKIAIDPGHIGGSKYDAIKERKIVNLNKDTSGMRYDSLVHDSSLIEGNITFRTALLLKKKLEDKGATVLLTRSDEGENAFGYSFDEWMKKDFKKAVLLAYKNKEINAKMKNRLLNPKTSGRYIFRYFFLQEDLKQRAKKINAFKPDLTIVIHYNANEDNIHANKLTDKNANMVFIPGSYMQDEMGTVRERFEFLRLLLTDDIPNSEKAASLLLTSFVKKLKVPAADESSGSYLSEKCIYRSKGVYCRNLALTRFVHGTIVYGESLFQDNKEEFWKLRNTTDISIDGVEVYSRIHQVADAYYEAVLQIFKQ